MLKNIQTFWHQQSPKDQMYLAVGAIATSIFLLWVLLCKPLIEWRDKERQRTVNLTHTLTTVESLVHQLQQQQSRDGHKISSNNNLADIVDASLRDNELRMKGFQPGRNGEARLVLENATYKPLIQWLYDLEYKHDIKILELHLAQTQTIGLLKVSLSLKKLQ